MTKWILACVLLAGCAVPAQSADEDGSESNRAAASAVPTITFGADWSVKVDGTLRAGGKVDVVYDPARLPDCRGTQEGRPQWSLGADWSYAGTSGTAPVAGNMAPAEPRFTIDLPVAGEISMWFENGNRWGCHAYDSAYGANYHFKVLPPENAPGWMGNVASVISRATCDGKACDADRHALDGFRFDTWARQRAAITGAFFDVWKEGVTDRDDPDLWKKLDVRTYYRPVGASTWSFVWVPFEKRVGNDARYQQSLRAIDPLGGSTRTDKSQCPQGTLKKSADGQYVELEVELYFTVNGQE
ncbi:MAG: DUF6209 family protein, partial [Polyangiales bacterium]